MPTVSGQGKPMRGQLSIGFDQRGAMHVRFSECELCIGVAKLGGTTQVLQAIALVCPASATLEQQATKIAHRLPVTVLSGIVH